MVYHLRWSQVLMFVFGEQINYSEIESESIKFYCAILK